MKIVLVQTKDDLVRVRTLISLSKLAGKTDLEKAKRYDRQALRLAEIRKYNLEICSALNSLGSHLHTQSIYDSSLYYHRSALALATRNKFNAEVVMALQGISEGFMRLTGLDSAEFYLQQALVVSARLKDPDLEAGLYNDLGNIYLEEHNYPEALKQFIVSAKLYESVSPQNRGLSNALVNIGNIEQIQGHYDKALDYTIRGLKFFEENKLDHDIAYCRKLLGRIYRKQGASDKALQNYRLALTLYTRLGDRRNVAETHHSIGNIFFDQKKFREALHQYEESLSVSAAISNQSQVAYSYSAIAYAWYELKNVKKSIAYFDSSMLKGRQVQNRYLVMDAYEMLSSIQEEQGNYKAALKLHRSFSALRDSLSTAQNNKVTEELETQYQTAKKQAEIELLQKDQQMKSVTLRQQRIVQSVLVFAIILIVIIGFLLFNRYRSLQRTRRQAEAEGIRNRIARDLHDDIGSTLSSINIMSQLAVKENKPEYFSQYLQRIGEQSAKMMERMSDMVWSINPGNDSLEKMAVKMKEFLIEMLESKNIGYQFKCEETLNGTILNPEKRKSLFLIFKETINNSAKYSDASFIDITLLQSGNQLLLTIADNGKGFAPTQVKKGNGLRNMKERAEEMDASLELYSDNGSGTMLKLAMTLHD